MPILPLYLLMYGVAVILFFVRKPSKNIRLNGLLFLLNFNTLMILVTWIMIELGMSYMPNNVLFQWIVQIIGLLIVMIVMFRPFVYKVIKRYESVSFYLLIVQCGIYIFGLIICIICFSTELTIMEQLLILTAYLLYICVAHLIVHQIEQLQLQSQQKESKNRIAEDMIPIINQIRRVQHDYANILSALVNQEGLDASYQSSVVHLKNPNQFDAFGKVAPMIRTALYMKSRQLIEQNIEFLIYTWFDAIDIYTVNPKEYEIVTILMNLINNGVEALNKKVIDDPHLIKKVIVKMTIKKGILEIKVGNSGDTIDATMFEKWLNIGFTTKTTGYHGFGLHTIKLFIEKYQGKISLERDENIDYIVVTL